MSGRTIRRLLGAGALVAAFGLATLAPAGAQEGGALHGRRVALDSGPLGGVVLALAHGVGAQAQQQVGDSDADGADLLAGAAERAGLGELVGVGEVGLEQRGEHGADRAGVDAAVGVSAD